MVDARVETIPPVPVEPKKKVIIELSVDEASALMALTGVGHHDDVSGALFRALDDAGVSHADYVATTRSGGWFGGYRVKKRFADE
jgi:hypothetical protein